MATIPTPFPSAWLTFVGVLDLQIARTLVAEFTNAITAGVQRVHLLIQSPGGNVNEGVFLFNHLSSLPIEVITYNSGHVGSAATIAYLGATKRIATKDATFLIHRARASASYAGNADEMAASAASLQLDDWRMSSIVESRVALTKRQLKTIVTTDLVLSCEDAIVAGLVHEIGVFQPEGLLRSV